MDNDLLAIGRWVDDDRVPNLSVEASPRQRTHEKHHLYDPATEILRGISRLHETQYTIRSRRSHYNWRHDLRDELQDRSPKGGNTEVRTTQMTRDQYLAYPVEAQGGEKGETTARLPVWLDSMQWHLRRAFSESSPYLPSEGNKDAGSSHPQVLRMTKDCQLLDVRKLSLV
ncbi:hypothetical protein RRF57_011024 [Xylaria bambusicola]|uniref:Uncharacterized protein n=1 Tax=Xylaria bambusicola TaxID=326684 RepID=A0AAN7Z9B7_9PEZI